MKTSAKIIADTVHPQSADARIITIEYEMPRNILAELNTHGVIAKCAASSRAIPVARRIEMAETSPFVPKAFGKNARGMQARGEIGGEDAAECFTIWQDAVNDAVRHAKRMNARGVHKQQANRILEPYVYVKGVITMTEWDNFFNLRYSPAADPEFENLAREMKIIIDASVPVEGRLHLPYIQEEDKERGLEEQIMVSAARVARISYKAHDGTTSAFDKDIELCRQLLTDRHMSPFDQPAMADDIIIDEDAKTGSWANPRHHGRYFGWVPVRREIEKQLGIKSRRDSFEPMILK